MAAEDTDAQHIGTHRMMYALNVPHYYVERPDFIFYRTEQMIRGVTAKPGDRFILSQERREIQDKGPFDIHFMTTRQRTGWTRETVLFRSGEPSPYPVEEKWVDPVPAHEEETIRRIVIRPYEPSDEVVEDEDLSESPFRIRTDFATPMELIGKNECNVRSYWDEIYDAEHEFDDLEENPLEDLEEDPFEDPLEELR